MSVQAPFLRRGKVKPADRHQEEGYLRGEPGDVHIYQLRGPSGRRIVPEDLYSDSFGGVYFTSAREGGAEPEDEEDGPGHRDRDHGDEV